MTKLNIGMIGAGFIGQLAHLMNFIEVPNCQVQALAEFKPELRKKVAARYGIPKTYATHTELLQDPDIDAVVVVTPRPLTGPVVLDCLKAGKHVLSEKPMVGCKEQGKLLLEAAQAKKVKYAVGYMKRYDEGVAAAKKALDEALNTGSLGTILSVHAKCYMGNSYCNAYGHVVTQETVDSALIGWSIAPKWLPETYHIRFGAYLNTYSHVTNLLRYLFNTMPSVEFVNLTSHAGQLAILGFNGFLATLETGKMSHQGWSEEIRITFTDGEIALFLPPALLRNVPASVEIYRAGKTQEIIRPYLNWSWAFRRQAEAFVIDILEERPMLNSAEEAYQEIILAENIWEAEMQRINQSNNNMMGVAI
jgi:predicted dehydrogenase